MSVIIPYYSHSSVSSDSDSFVFYFGCCLLFVLIFVLFTILIDFGGKNNG